MRIPAFLCAALLIPANVAAQDGGSSAHSVQERHDILVRDQEALADPDPLMRLATMEAIIASGDATAIYLAMRTAFAADDPALRNLAMRTWVAGLKRVNLTVELPGDLQKQVDTTLADPKQGDQLFESRPWLAAWARRSFDIALEFSDVDVGKNTGKVVSLPNGGQPAVFTLSGTQIFITAVVDFPGGGSYCHLRLAPTNALLLEGTISCQFNQPSPQLHVSTPML